MATKVIMPKQGLQMTEGTITHWLVREGERVKVDQPLFEMETDKLTITIYSAVAGTVLKIVRGEGEVVPITDVIAIVGEPGESYSDLLPASPAAAPAGKAGQVAAPSPSPVASAAPARQAAGGRIFASPRAKLRADELGVDIATLAGSAPDGMIVERDVLAAAASAPKATPLAKKIAEQGGIPLAGIAGSGPRGKIRSADVLAGRGADSGEKNVKPMGGMRKIIAQRMKQSLNENAQATHRIKVRMAEASRCRETLKAAGLKISYNDLIAFCVVRALREHPVVNAELLPTGIWRKDFVNLGVAVALDEGLVVPVVRDADVMSLSLLSESIKDLADRAKANTLSPDDCSGGSFTISNLGMFGLEEFTAIINPPESGILAVGAIEPTPVAVGDKVEVQPVMSLTLSYDHRVIDGAPAARFLGSVKEYLENPYRLL